MERDAHYAAVGIATVALAVALIIFSIWLARLSFNEEYDVYDIVFYGPVRGLSEGGEVHFNGIRVGLVTDLRLDQEKGDQVVARIRIDATTPVRVTSRAQLEPQGITGLNYIQITAGTEGSALLKTQYPNNVVPVIQSQPSPIAELLSGSGTVLAQTVDALNRINRVLSDENIRSFSVSVRNIEALSTELEARKGMFGELEQALVRANAAMAEYQALGVSARRLVETDGQEAVANLNNAAEQAVQAAEAANRLIANLEGPVNDFAASGLPQLEEAIRGLDDATRSLESLVDEVRSSPREFISRPPSQELEVQP
ncbi:MULTISPECIES: MlaD family protein [unclassified Brevundimonas]|jgi:phospholipid/cholesterol/gamma-HCH transport system substrate-binding protein|uniref:MlaD family protein n=1 Tax=unclassified Brevundimonas TaxID=2622653 RepID=UPI000C4037C1|nr:MULTISPECIES: MlaD family protein [unclassified Brevundimonas]MAL87359.1 ABC transporter substrate-binding protein [Brevundimonas sp.]HAJ02939.1 MCE family protein [Brevundimonas sp.]HAV49625.1 MCE family protein [Brevundimonas sp.]|tara:strand:- start:74326 stop:75264 length:939 start_codon:yes stop_codon:yes gene_type:complete